MWTMCSALCFGRSFETVYIFSVVCWPRNAFFLSSLPTGQMLCSPLSCWLGWTAEVQEVGKLGVGFATFVSCWTLQSCCRVC